MGRTACTEPQCLYKGALHLYSVLVGLYKLGNEFSAFRGRRVQQLVTASDTRVPQGGECQNCGLLICGVL